MLSGLTFDGNQANITSFPSPFDEQDSHCLYLCYVDGLRVKNIRIINAIRYSIFMVQCSHSSVRFSHIISGREAPGMRTQQDGIHLAGCSYCVIAENNVDTGATAGVGDDAICLQALTSGHPVTDITVTGNVLRSGARGIALVPHLDNIRNVEITSNNILETQDDGIVFNVTRPGPACSNITIARNKFGNIAAAGKGHGIDLQSITTAGYQDVVISGNSFGTFMNPSGFGIYAGQGNNLKIDGNSFDNFQGIRVINIGDDGVRVDRFRVWRNMLSASNGPAGKVGVMVIDSQNGIVSGNVINGSASASSYGVELLGITAVVTGVVVNANRILNWTHGVAESNAGAQPDYNAVTSNVLDGCATAVLTQGAHDVVANNKIKHPR